MGKTNNDLDSILNKAIEDLEEINVLMENFNDFQLNDTIAQVIPEDKEDDTEFNMLVSKICIIRAKEELARIEKNLKTIFKLIK